MLVFSYYFFFSHTASFHHTCTPLLIFIPSIQGHTQFIIHRSIQCCLRIKNQEKTKVDRTNTRKRKEKVPSCKINYTQPRAAPRPPPCPRSFSMTNMASRIVMRVFESSSAGVSLVDEAGFLTET